MITVVSSLDVIDSGILPYHACFNKLSRDAPKMTNSDFCISANWIIADTTEFEQTVKDFTSVLSKFCNFFVVVNSW